MIGIQSITIWEAEQELLVKYEDTITQTQEENNSGLIWILLRKLENIIITTY
jgi:hypothetical protein